MSLKEEHPHAGARLDTACEIAAHTLRPAEALGRLQSSAAGLAAAEAKVRLERFGPNELREAPPPPLWRKFLKQFASVLVVILLVAAVISGALGEWPETVAILAIVLLNAAIGFLQEERAERALAALRKLAAPAGRVTRDGRERSLPAAELVPGDLIHVEAGDQVPADARLIESFNLSAQEAALTGESTPDRKDAALVLTADTPLADRRNMIYAGTSVATGKARAVVMATGMRTELGRIAGLLARTENEPTPLQRRLAGLGKHLALACGVIIAIIFALHIARGRDPLEVLLFAVSLAVAAVPEGLPAVVTIALALGVQRMVRRNALIRNLPSVETLGSVTVICSDKTGTLTHNQMTVREIWTLTGRFRITGEGYAPEGEFRRIAGTASGSEGADGEVVDPSAAPDLRLSLIISAVCNNAQLEHDERDGWQVLGDPTEGALRVAAMKARIDETAFERLHEIPFDSERKAMSVVARDPHGAVAMFTKGAPEALLTICTQVQRGDRLDHLTPEIAEEIRRTADDMAARALRVLALAYRPLDDAAPAKAQERHLVFVGLAGMIDPPRAEAARAVELCRTAGIRPMMITGDHPTTGLAVAREVKLAYAGDVAITGPELDEISDEALPDRVQRTAVFARVTPEHKLRIVRALQSRGHVTAMTGDGVNDAPAVKAADIGIAMGRTGSDVTRSASDMVLLDDNFASIVAAVEEGRGIFDNIQKVTHYLLSCNAGELMFLFFAALIGWPAPMLAVQILWINLITDGVPALALGVEPPERDIMRRPPRRPGQPLISATEAALILAHGGLIALVAGGSFAWAYSRPDADLVDARTVAFGVTAYAQLFLAVGFRSHRYTMPQLGWLTNPAIFWAVALSAALQFAVMSLPAAQGLFSVKALDVRSWAAILLLSLAPVTIVETAKLLRTLTTQSGIGVRGDRELA